MLHSFQLNGYNIVMDVNSGAVHVVDGMVYDMIQLLDADFLVPFLQLAACKARFQRCKQLCRISLL